MIKGITNSTVLVACVTESYQASEFCMFELKKAAETNKPIIPLILQPGGSSIAWASVELRSICKFSTRLYCDVSAVASQTNMWKKDVEPTESALAELKQAVKSSHQVTCNLLKLLGDACLSGSTDRQLSASAANMSLKASADVPAASTTTQTPPAEAPQERKSLFSRLGMCFYNSYFYYYYLHFDPLIIDSDILFIYQWRQWLHHQLLQTQSLLLLLVLLSHLSMLLLLLLLQRKVVV